jgi:micrococcal nuclease
MKGHACPTRCCQGAGAGGIAPPARPGPSVELLASGFLSAQRDARSHERGLWGAVCNEPEPVSTGGGGAGGGNCDPSYPGVCIPPYPPDLDCDDVPFSFFEVKPPDPHDFDSDEDADLIGCES